MPKFWFCLTGIARVHTHIQSVLKRMLAQHFHKIFECLGKTIEIRECLITVHNDTYSYSSLENLLSKK